MYKKQIFNYTLWLVFCLIGGFVGSWFYDYSVNRYVNSFAGSSLMSRYDSALPLIIRDAKKVVVEQSEKTISTINASEAFLFGVFKKSANGQYNLTKTEAEALVLTSDGWLITNFAGTDKDWQNAYVVIDKDGKIFKIDNKIDDASGLSFIHLSGAQGLVVAEFMKARDLRRGQTIIVANWLAEASSDIITKVDANPDVIKSSDQPYKQVVTKLAQGTGNPLIALDISGQVLGFFNKEKKLLATDYFIYKTSSLLAAKKNTIPVLGVNYYNLAWQAGSPLNNQGAVLVKNGVLPAVIKGSPAEAAALKEGDIILSLDNVVVNRSLDLADILSDYRPGDKVIVKYLRDAREKSVEITLAGK